MECKTGEPNYLLEPNDRKGRLFLLPEIAPLLEKKKYNKPVKLEKEEFAFASCDGENYNSLIYIPRWNSSLYEETSKRMKDLKLKHKPLIVMQLTIDSYSRRHFYRKLPKTVAYLNNLSSDFSAFDFLLHNVFGASSVQNILPIFSDLPIIESEIPREYDALYNYSMWNFFRQNGFVSLLALEDCNYYFPNAIGRYPNVDYKVRSLYCAAKSILNLDHEIFSRPVQRCIGKYMSHWYTFNYTQEFSRLYKGLNQWMYLHMSTAHEATGQHAATLDEDLIDFLEFYIKELSKEHEIAIFLHADHGMRYGNWYQDIEAYQENKLPVFFIIASNSLLDRIPGSYENLKANTQRLTTKKDLRPTINYLAHMPYGSTFENQSKNNIYVNLFTELALLNRTCDDLGISPFDCSCLVLKEIFDYEEDEEFTNLLHTLIEEAIYKINTAVNTPYIGDFKLCQKLSFRKIINVYGLMLNNKVEELQIKFAVNENSAAIFEVSAFVGTHIRSPVLIASSYRNSILTYLYRGYRTRIKIVGIKRKDKYAGICENVARKLKMKAELCVCNSNTLAQFMEM
jgi:hypothetical protein